MSFHLKELEKNYTESKETTTTTTTKREPIKIGMKPVKPKTGRKKKEKSMKTKVSAHPVK